MQVSSFIQINITINFYNSHQTQSSTKSTTTAPLSHTINTTTPKLTNTPRMPSITCNRDKASTTTAKPMHTRVKQLLHYPPTNVVKLRIEPRRKPSPIHAIQHRQDFMRTGQVELLSLYRFKSRRCLEAIILQHLHSRYNPLNPRHPQQSTPYTWIWTAPHDTIFWTTKPPQVTNVLVPIARAPEQNHSTKGIACAQATEHTACGESDYNKQP